MADEKTHGADTTQPPQRGDDENLEAPRQDRQVSDEELDKISGGGTPVNGTSTSGG